MLTSQKKHALALRFLWILLFSIAMGYFEASIVVYMRKLYYPDGFGMPLKMISPNMIAVELGREVSSILMLASVAALTARRFWERFSWFLIMFGLWDLFYYAFLKIILDWPHTLTDWDILFLIPLPWLAPWIAPALIAVLMIIFGIISLSRFHSGHEMKPDRYSWLFAVIGTILILYSFMRDLDAGLHQAMPKQYLWSLLFVGIIFYIYAFIRFLGANEGT